MQTNLGKIDRAIRILLGLVILGLGYYLQTAIGLTGLLPIITAMIGWCPSYLPFDITTCRSLESK